MIAYVIQSSIGLAISYLLYRLFLKNEKTFTFNRYYLLGAIIFSLLIPTLKIQTSTTIPVVSQINALSVGTPVTNSIETVTVERFSNSINIFPQLLLYLYLLFTSILVIRFIRNLLRIKQHTKKHGTKINGQYLVMLKEHTNPFSFFNYIFVNNADFSSGKISTSLINHEQAHGNQFHSIDIILVELVICFYWFNPFIWFIKNAITENHEYLADRSVTQLGLNIDDYSTKIIQSINTLHPLYLTSGFSFIQTKNRIIMLKKSPSSAIVKTAKLMGALILLVATLTLSSFGGESNGEQFVVIVDAGHGGHDPGASFEQLLEKDITLKISQRLMEMSSDNQIKVILTRNSDEFIKLNDRPEYANTYKANMFLSIHANNNSLNIKAQGIEAYYYEDNEYSSQSYAFSKILISEQLSTISNKGEIKTGPFIVLKRSKCPSVVLQLGYISNEEDRKKLENPEYLDKIASSIYNGLIKIKNQTH